VGIRELKAHLSRYVAQVKAGERIVVTDRGEQVAELVPISRESLVLDRLTKQGRVSWSGRRPQFDAALPHSGPPLSDAVLELREERTSALDETGA